MEVEYIHIKDFCRGHNLKEEFIVQLQDYELIALKIIDEQQFIYIEELPKVEKLVRLHQDLHINIDGLEAIHYLLERTQQMSEELHLLKKRLNRYETM
ncbi:MAG: chaperone modulator CbpM [Maribacter sp.]